MSEPTKPSSDASSTTVQTTLDDLLKIKAQANAVLQAIQAHAQTAESRNSDIEQGRAFAIASKGEVESGLGTIRELLQQAKQQVDAGAAAGKEITELRATAKAEENQIAEADAQVRAALETVKTSSASVAEGANRVETFRVQVEQAASAAATKSAHIEQGRIHADEVRSKLDAVLVAAQQSATNAEAQHQVGKAGAEGVAALLATAQTTKASIDAASEAVVVLRAQSEKHMASTKALADTATGMEASIKASEARLAELQVTAGERLKTIEALLLGATNAGLAHAFDARSKTFHEPQKNWQWAFFGALAALLAVAIWEAVSYRSLSTVPNYSELFRMLLFRLPFFLPIVWFAIHASFQASLAKRMEEEYAFKATISTSFEGYRRQMAEIGKDLPETSPLARLCNETLRTIGTPPGKVYDKHRLNPTPGTAAADIVGPVVDGVAKTLAAKLPGARG